MSPDEKLDAQLALAEWLQQLRLSLDYGSSPVRRPDLGQLLTMDAIESALDRRAAKGDA